MGGEGVRLRGNCRTRLHNTSTRRRRFTYNKITIFICFCLYNTFILNGIKKANQRQEDRAERREGRARAEG